MQERLLGHILLEKKLVSHDDLLSALIDTKRSGSRLGDVLVSQGLIDYRRLYEALAAYHQLAWVDLLETPPDADLLGSDKAEDYLALGAIPWKKEGDKLYIATTEVTENLKRWAHERFGENVHFVITSPYDLRHAVAMHFREELDEKSRLALWRAAPSQSARNTMPMRQQLVLALVVALLISGITYFPWQTLLVVLAFCHLIFFSVMLFKALVYMRGRNIPPKQDWELTLARLKEKDLPVYSILIPMYKEAESLPGMLASMRNLDYPASKLDIKLVLEADDEETLSAAFALKPNYNFDIIRVPPSLPRTKPKACNYALRFARGEFLTLYDADDRPDPLQLKKAVAMFRTQDPSIVCLQARLNYYNTFDNWLTRFFSLEYAMLFHAIMPGLQSLNIPLPLGGTSNHIALARIKELGEWDPFNVTEDADLGTRLAARGYRTVMLDSDTMEEAPNSVMAWLRQRSRWIKGYMQTWLVHMRHPIVLFRTLKLSGYAGFQFFIGLSSFSFLSAPIVWFISLAWLLQDTHVFPDWLLYLTFSNLVMHLAVHSACALDITRLYPQAKRQLLLSGVIYPFYLVLHSVASYLALWQLIVKPHVWNKTAHGRAKTFTENPLTAGQNLGKSAA